MLAPRPLAAATLAALLSLSAAAPARAQAHPPATARQEAVVTAHARGTFEVKLTPQPMGADAEQAMLARLTIDKRFAGDLEGTSVGQMLSAGTAVQGSAGYVAIERVSGTLAGRRGTFVLQHSGTMNRGAPQLVISVVPDSATGELEGLAGTMTIDLSGGGHAYELTYTLPAR